MIYVSVVLSTYVEAKERVKVMTTGEQPGHYLTWDREPILPIGDSTTQGWMESGLNFDQEGYLDALSSRGINLAMLWSYLLSTASSIAAPMSSAGPESQAESIKRLVNAINHSLFIWCLP